MEVKVDGKPKPKVAWYKQGVEVVPSKDFQVEEYEDGTTVLTIPEVFPDDTGEITCVAENEYGVATTSTELVVEGMLVILSEIQWFILAVCLCVCSDHIYTENSALKLLFLSSYCNGTLVCN
jgi:hypothetical protein